MKFPPLYIMSFTDDSNVLNSKRFERRSMNPTRRKVLKQGVDHLTC